MDSTAETILPRDGKPKPKKPKEGWGPRVGLDGNPIASGGDKSKKPRVGVGNGAMSSFETGLLSSLATAYSLSPPKTEVSTLDEDYALKAMNTYIERNNITLVDFLEGSGIKILEANGNYTDVYVILKDITLDVILCSYCERGMKFSLTHFKGELISFGVTPLIAAKIYVRLEVLRANGMSLAAANTDALCPQSGNSTMSSSSSSVPASASVIPAPQFDNRAANLNLAVVF